MLFKNLQLAFRNLSRHKNYAVINIMGLAIGIASCILIFLVVRYELSFDSFHSKKDHIYRVFTVFSGTEGTGSNRGVPFPLPEALRRDFPQLEKVAALFTNSNDQVAVTDEDNNDNKKIFKERRGVFFVEPQFFQIFDFGWLAGDARTALSEPNTAVLTRETADRYFGDWKIAVGKNIQLNNRRVCKITGILENIPANSDFPFKVLVSYKSISPGVFQDWVTVYGYHNCFVLLPEQMSPGQFNALLPAFVKKHKPADRQGAGHQLQPLNNMHFNTDLGNYNDRSFSKGLIKVLILIGIFLLLIACVNYINLATGQSIIRSKEVGVRKVLGSGTGQIRGQFLTETFLLAAFAVLIGLGMAILALPYLNNLLKLSLSLKIFGDPAILFFLLSLLIIIALLSGFYPAIILSRFSPVIALKNKLSASAFKGMSLRRALVIFQFIIAQTLVIGTLVVVSQMNFFRNAPKGFDTNAIVNVPIPEDSLRESKMNLLRAKLLQYNKVVNMSFSFTTPMEAGSWYSDFRFNNAEKRTSFEAMLQWADADYLKTYKLELIAGRMYVPADTVREFVVNESMVRKLGLINPEEILGKYLDFWEGQTKALVVGVVKDFHTQSLQNAIDPVVMGSYKATYAIMGIKIQMQGFPETLAYIEKSWRDIFPDYAYESWFLDQQIANYYRQENQLATLYQLFAGIAIFIACLGLYGLVSFMVAQRVKEVGIRKVLGASVAQILYLFTKEFILLVTLAFIVAAPVAYFIMQNWLQDFEFRIDIGWWIFALAGILSVGIALATISFKAIKAAITNPVKSLRTE